jgi:hypothetical protein
VKPEQAIFCYIICVYVIPNVSYTLGVSESFCVSKVSIILLRKTGTFL